ncbi:MAG: hypothetical protein Q8927_16415 [Bacteroidota bacterium]|nr:hypothetical protein [Bacteroidota bacterium]MDP4217787.1 hypothetical protein [Bacteroidota bacterium]MDP4246815.1 hypothetical protein [Bacteroidota bacterium]MDP4256419.1 hypothetical protein [Bacteroidota bacterium]MDP4258152.1 hypothetical protein [Bacteroidota bacterium]
MRSVSVLLLFISMLGARPIRAQKNNSGGDGHASLLPGRRHSLIAWSGKGHAFTMEVPGKSAKPSDLPGFITIDNQIVQTTLVAASQNIDLNYLTINREKDILTKYMNYELAYYKKRLKQDYSNVQTEWLTMQGHIFLLWYFDMPKDYKLVNRQVYLSTLFFDQIMDLNAPLFTIGDFNRARELLVRLAGSLKTFDKNLDLTVLAHQLNK